MFYNNYKYLKDSSFLKELTGVHVKEYFIKITVLDWLENPVQDIQGRVTSANISIDGNSSVRRTANISMVADDLIYNITNVNSLISINKKVTMQIGYINSTGSYQEYDILWFPLGTYVIISASVSHSNSGTTVSLQLKDKMVLLNGECGGTLPASTVFDNYETLDDNGEWVIQRPTIYQIIRELVNHFGQEQLGKIVISDLDTRVKQVMKWTGSTPLYFVTNTNQQDADQFQITTDPAKYEQFCNKGYTDVLGSPFAYGDDVGFIYTDFTYPGQLIGDAGDTVVDILQKIKGVLGNFEYFYDLEGNFVFQQIKNYLNNSQSKYVLDSFRNKQLVPDYLGTGQAYLLDAASGKSVFEFNDSNLITAYNNSPQYGMIKNDYMVWGIRKDIEGYQFPIRYHLVIDKKPTPGNTYQAFQYTDPDDNIPKWHMPIKFETTDDFPDRGAAGVFYMDTSSGTIYKWTAADQEYKYVAIDAAIKKVTTTDWRSQLYFQGVTAQPYGTQSNFYYTQLLNEWPLIYEILPDQLDSQGNFIANHSHFKESVIRDPSSINYYLDFIDTAAAVSEFSVDNIGRRTQVISEDGVNCVFEPYIQDVVLLGIDAANKSTYSLDELRTECIDRGQKFHQVESPIYDALAVGGTLYSAYEQVRQLLHQYTSYNENISIQTLPIYFLQPNTRITVRNEQSNIYGDYMINSLSFALDQTGILTINASRALEKI